jgi:hypothetical protein
VAPRQVAEVLHNFGPVFVGRGVVQISAYVDTVLASLLPTGAVAGLSYAQVIYTLPVSLFGMSVSAAELPTMASAVGSESERAGYLRGRLDGGLRQIAFFVVPSAMAFLALGDVVAGALYQSGAFTRAMTVYVWAILAGSAVGSSRPPWAGSTPRPTTRCTIRGRRSDSPWSASPSRSAWAISSHSRCRRRSGSSRGGAPRGSPPPPGSRGGSSSSCSDAPSTRGSAGPASRSLTRQALGSCRPRRGGRLGATAVLPVQGRPVVAAVALLGVFGLVYLGLTAAMGVAESSDWWAAGHRPTRPATSPSR